MWIITSSDRFEVKASIYRFFLDLVMRFSFFMFRRYEMWFVDRNIFTDKNVKFNFSLQYYCCSTYWKRDSSFSCHVKQILVAGLDFKISGQISGPNRWLSYHGCLPGVSPNPLVFSFVAQQSTDSPRQHKTAQSFCYLEYSEWLSSLF